MQVGVLFLPAGKCVDKKSLTQRSSGGAFLRLPFKRDQRGNLLTAVIFLDLPIIVSISLTLSKTGVYAFKYTFTRPSLQENATTGR
jgi:hypothetical protein